MRKTVTAVSGDNMARLPRDSRIETREARRRLKIQKRAYRTPIVSGVFLAYAKGAKRGTWIARWREGTDYREQRIGAADDTVDADGEVVLNYSQAVKAAQELASGRDRPLPKFYGDGYNVGQALDAYLDWRRQDRPDSSANRTDQAAFNRHVRPKFGTRATNSLTARELSEWLLALATSAPTLRGKQGSRVARADINLKNPDVRRQRRQTANRVWNAFRAALNHAWRDESTGVATDAAWRRVKSLDVPEGGPPRMLEPAEITRLLNAAEGTFRALLRGALLTGARYGELVALRVDDFRVDDKFIVIRQRKTGKALTQPLTDEGSEFFEQMTAGKDADDLVFMRDSQNGWRKSDQARPMRETAARANVSGVSFKTTRATYGKNLLLATQNIELVAKALGHSDARITRKHYAQYLPNELAEGVRKMAPIGIAESNIRKIGARAGRKK